MAGTGGLAVGGPLVHAGPTDGSPNPYLPGTRVPDPQYAAKKQEYDNQQRAITAQRAATQRGQSSFLSAANNNANYSMSHVDPETGLQLNYNPGAAGGRAGAGGPTEPETRVSLAELTRDADTVSPPIVPDAMPAHVDMPNRASRLAANEAAYGAAKSKIGVQGRASLNALHSQMGERGISGSGIEGALTGGIIAAGQHDLAGAVLGQTTADLNREEAVEDRNYAGDITQRSQDLTGRGQNIGAQESTASGKRAAIQALFNMRTNGAGGGRLY